MWINKNKLILFFKLLKKFIQSFIGHLRISVVDRIRIGLDPDSMRFLDPNPGGQKWPLVQWHPLWRPRDKFAEYGYVSGFTWNAGSGSTTLLKITLLRTIGNFHIFWLTHLRNRHAKLWKGQWRNVFLAPRVRGYHFIQLHYIMPAMLWSRSRVV